MALGHLQHRSAGRWLPEVHQTAQWNAEHFRDENHLIMQKYSIDQEGGGEAGTRQQAEGRSAAAPTTRRALPKSCRWQKAYFQKNLDHLAVLSHPRWSREKKSTILKTGACWV